jgi:hypothetical protein
VTDADDSERADRMTRAIRVFVARESIVEFALLHADWHEADPATEGPTTRDYADELGRAVAEYRAALEEAAR